MKDGKAAYVGRVQDTAATVTNGTQAVASLGGAVTAGSVAAPIALSTAVSATLTQENGYRATLNTKKAALEALLDDNASTDLAISNA